MAGSVFALMTMASAMSKSADSSDEDVAVSCSVSITGTIEFSVTKVISQAPPRGMITSTSPPPDQLTERLPSARIEKLDATLRHSGLRQNLHQPLIAVRRFFAAARTMALPVF